MKVFIASLFLLASTFAQAHPVVDFLQSQKVLTGEGTWRAADGVNDIWTSTLTIAEQTRSENSVTSKLTWNIDVTHNGVVSPMTSTLLLTVNKDLFIKIFDETGVFQVGLGYCDQQTCHISTSYQNGSSMEETWAVTDGTPGMTILGSTTFGGVNEVGVVYRGTYTETK